MYGFWFVVAGGAVAATLDIVYACAFWAVKSGVPVLRILQSIAAGALGKAAFSGGVGTAALGLALHYLIAFLMSLTYWFAARQMPVLWQRPWLCGAIYGLALYVVMNHVVLPLSAAGPASKDPLWITLSIAAHIALVGVPVASFARLALRRTG